jgi:peptide/nickel transport system substrate-binding protein
MKSRVWWLVAGFGIAVSLMLVPESKAAQEEPKYGGVLTIALPTALGEGWDPIHAGRYVHLHPVLLCLKRGDFYKGPGGTKETSWLYPTIAEPELTTSGLAKSWEITGPDTVVYHLNKGIHWQNKPPMNGREVTAEDVVWGYQRLLNTADSGLSTMTAKPASLTASDKYTFVMKLAEPDMRTAFTIDDWYRITPREVIEKHGNMDDWKNVVGNGPFILKDYVAGNSITYEKNPNYWEKDPQGRSLPYVDGLKFLIITDASTRLAALRTGQIDMVLQVPWKDAEKVLETNPEVKTTGGYTWVSQKLQFNVKEGVFSDVRVRRAMAMAIDHEAIVKGMHEGHSKILPSGMFAPSDKWFMETKDYPPSAQELYQYNPDKAKKLLAEAGYPKGFKTMIEIMSIHSDYASLLASFWSEIGVEAEIKVNEPAAFVSKLYGKKLNLFMLTGDLQGARRESWRWDKGGAWNFSQIDDPKLWELRQAAISEKDRKGWGKEWQALTKYLVDQVYEHQIPGPDVHNLWRPRVKNYHGEFTLSSTDWFGFAPYVWLDDSVAKK